MFDVYIRVSRLGDRTEDEATEVYEEQCVRTAERLDLDLDEIVDDTNVSGSIEVAERELERLIQKIENGESDGIIVPFTDRFGRDVIEGMLAYRRIALAGGRLIGAMDGLDSASPGSKEIFGYRMVTAESFLDRTKANYQAAVDRKVAKGAYIYKTPFGYRKDEDGRLVVDEANAALVRELFERRAAGEDMGSLTRWFEEAGALQPHQGRDEDGNRLPPRPFSKNGLRGLLGNRAYLGEISVQNGKKGQPRVIKAYHPAIVSEHLFETANAVKGTFHPRDHSLSGQVKHRGLVYCATCGKRCKVGGYTTKGERKANYVCTTRGCKAHVGMQAGRLDAYVQNLLLHAAVAKEPHVAAVIEGDTRYTDALAALSEAQRLHDELRDDPGAQAALGMKDWLAALKVRKEAVVFAKKELAKVRPNGAAKKSDQVVTFEEFITEHERDANARLIDRIVVKPKPAGRGTKNIDPAERIDVYLAGSDKPYVLAFGKLDEELQAQIDRHLSGEDKAIIAAIDARLDAAVA